MAGLIPGYIDQVNTILRWWENPCDAPWTLYFELALPAAGDAALTLLSFGLDDIVRGYFRPKNLRTGRHLRRGSKAGRRGLALPEFGEEIGKRLPGAERARGRNVTQGVKNLWLVDGVIQRGLFYWMVADVTLDFFATWLSAVQESEVCRTQRVGAAAWEATPTVAAIQGWRGFQVTPLYQTGTVSVSGSPAAWVSGFEWSGGTASVTVGIDGAKVEGTSGSPNLEVRLTQQGNVIAQEPATPSQKVPGRQTCVLSPRPIKGGGSTFVEIRCIPSGFITADKCYAACAQTLQDL